MTRRRRKREEPHQVIYQGIRLFVAVTLLAVALSGCGGSGSMTKGAGVPPPEVGEKSAPRAVRNLDAAGNEKIGRADPSVRLSWEAPADDGGSPVTGYRYRYRAYAGNTAGAWNSYTPIGGVTRVLVINLDDRTTYDFEVLAVNAEGAGPGTVIKVSNRPAAPADTGLVHGSPDTSAFRFSWSAVTATGTPVTGYVWEFRKSSDSTWTSRTVSATTTHVIATGLESRTSYDFRVRADTALRRGRYTTPVTGVTRTAATITAATPVLTTGYIRENGNKATLHFTLSSGGSWNAAAAARHFSVSGLPGAAVESVTNRAGRSMDVTIAYDGSRLDTDAKLEFRIDPAAHDGGNTIAATIPVAATAAEVIPSISVADVTVAEGARDPAFTLRITPTPNQDIHLRWTMTSESGDTADRNDYAVSSAGNPWTLAANAATHSLPMPITADAVDETDETFTLTLSGLSSNARFEGGGATLTARATIADDDTRADAPTGLSAVGTNAGEVDLTWTAPADAGVLNGSAATIGEYQYRTATTAAGLAAATWRDTDSAAASFTVAGLAAGEHYFQVRAKNGVTPTSDPSNTASATVQTATPIVPPSVPANLQASQRDASVIRIAWEASTYGGSGTVAYTSARRVSGSGNPWSEGGTGSDTTRTFSALTPGQDYDFRVRACVEGTDNCSDYVQNTFATLLETATVVATATVASTNPSRLTEADLDGATLTVELAGADWVTSPSAGDVTVSGVTGLTVSAVARQTDPARAAVTLDFDGTDFDADAVLNLTIAAAAHTGANTITVANAARVAATVKAAQAGAAPSVPANVRPLERVSFGIRITWDASTWDGGGTVVYTSERRLSGSGNPWSHSETRKSTTRTFVDLTPGQEYDFRVRACVEGTDNCSEYVQGTFAELPVTARVTSTTPATLTSENLDGATLAVRLAGGNWVASPSAGDVTVSGVPGVTVSVVARQNDWDRAVLTLAYDGTDFDSDATLSLTIAAAAHLGANTITVPNAATVLAVAPPQVGSVPGPVRGIVATGGEAFFAWWQLPESDGGSPITGHRVRYRTYSGGVAGEWGGYITGGVRRRVVEFRDASGSKAYDVEIQALNANGAGPGTIVHVPVQPPAPAASLVYASPDTSALTFSWSPVTGASVPLKGYFWEYRTEFPNSLAQNWIPHAVSHTLPPPVTSLATTSVTRTGLGPRTRYCFRVRADAANRLGRWTTVCRWTRTAATVSAVTPATLTTAAIRANGNKATVRFTLSKSCWNNPNLQLVCDSGSWNAAAATSHFSVTGLPGVAVDSLSNRSGRSIDVTLSYDGSNVGTNTRLRFEIAPDAHDDGNTIVATMPVTATDTDVPPTISVADVRLDEGALTSGGFTLKINPAPGQDIDLRYALRSETGDTAGVNDYVWRSFPDGTGNPATVPANAATHKFTVFINQDAIDETDETLTLTLSALSANARFKGGGAGDERRRGRSRLDRARRPGHAERQRRDDQRIPVPHRHDHRGPRYGGVAGHEQRRYLGHRHRPRRRGPSLPGARRHRRHR